jgi:hypothetical protein
MPCPPTVTVLPAPPAHLTTTKAKADSGDNVQRIASVEALQEGRIYSGLVIPLFLRGCATSASLPPRTRCMHDPAGRLPLMWQQPIPLFFRAASLHEGLLDSPFYYPKAVLLRFL